MGNMQTIVLTDRDYERVMLLANAWNVSTGEAIHRLLDNFAQDTRTGTSDDQPPDEDALDIYCEYEGHRIEASYQRATKRVSITSGLLAGSSYKSPSGAALAVVQRYNPKVHPNRNGWLFWFIAENGEPLQKIRRSSRASQW